MTVVRTPNSATDDPWPHHAGAYLDLVRDEGRDSHYLRTTGLRPKLLQLAGDCSAGRVLDAGCGDGWLLDALAPRRGYGCDVFRFDGFPGRWHFSLADVRALPYERECFDVTVASLLLMWFAELDAALGELRRVTRVGGRVVIALMHPHFYRTGEANADGSFTVERDLASPFVIDEHKIAESVGPFQYYYRPLSTYLNACIQAGLEIREVADWCIDMDDFVQRFGSDQPGAIRRTGKVPMYTFIACRSVAR